MTGAAPKPNPLLEIAVTIVAPGVVLSYGDALVGNVGALLLALALPVGWGVWDGVRRRHLNWLALVGIASTLLTGGVGLMRMDPYWLAVKEAAVPLLMALVIAASAWTRRPLIRVLVFDSALLDTQRIDAALAARGSAAAFDACLRTATLLLAGLFAATGIAGYALARWIVASPGGSAAFNQELGRLTLLSWPLVALPTMLAMLALVWWLARRATRLTGIAGGDLLRGA